MKRTPMIAAAIGIFSIVTANSPGAMAHCGKCGSDSRPKDIVETAVGAGTFKTLVEAVKAAGLVETLKSPGPFTVFAPTDEAFGKIPKKNLDALLANPDQLGAILKYHVVPGSVKAADVIKLTSAKTVLGQSVTINAADGVKVDKAKVVKADIETSNGIIHVIDTVLIPSNDIIETARTAGSFRTLLSALEAAGLTDALRADGPFTVFAPTDDAFNKLPAGTVEDLLKDIPKLNSILTYHVVSGKVTAADVADLTDAKTLLGQKLRIDASREIRINSARVMKADVFAENGVIHVIDEVLMPAPADVKNARASTRNIIQKAIHYGAPMYNSGRHAACMAIYEVAAMGLLASADATIGSRERDRLENALMSVQRSHNSRRNAWEMRHALDFVYKSVSQ